MSTTTVTTGGGYAGLWRSLPRELLYLLIAFPLATVGFSLTIGLFSAGLGTIVTFFIGVLLIIACLYIARGMGTLDIILLNWAGRRQIPKPDWMDERARTGFLGWVRAVLGNGHYWLYLLHVMIVDFVVATVTWALTIAWLSVALGGTTAWLWGALIPEGRTFFVSEWLFSVLGLPPTGWDFRLADSVLHLVIGVIFLLTLPFVIRGLFAVHWAIGRGMLGSWKSDQLRREVENLAEQRGAAQSAEGHSLRRLERDIHDGPQQRLVRLQMDLAAAERQLERDPDRARGLISEAMQQSKDALEELRALSRGFAPPILLDRGLVAALESAAVRNPVPTNVVSELPPELVLPQELERNAYFIAVEALTNATKHSGATEIEIRLSRRSDEGLWLEVTITDNGGGGATPVPDHGLAGLGERLRGLGGSLELSSPQGGPTVLSAHLPLAPAR